MQTTVTASRRLQTVWFSAQLLFLLYFCPTCAWVSGKVILRVCGTGRKSACGFDVDFTLS